MCETPMVLMLMAHDYHFNFVCLLASWLTNLIPTLLAHVLICYLSGLTNWSTGSVIFESSLKNKSCFLTVPGKFFF